MYFRAISTLLIFKLCFIIVFSQTPAYILEVVDDELGTSSQIHFIVLNSEFDNSNELRVNYYFNDQKLANECIQTLNFKESNDLKIICQIPEQFESGIYTVDAQIVNNENVVIFNIDPYSFFYSSSHEAFHHSFKQYEHGVEVTIYLPEYVQKGSIIYHDIPNELLDELTVQNQDDYILTTESFFIVDDKSTLGFETQSNTISYTLLNIELSNDLKPKFKTFQSLQNPLLILLIFSIIVLLFVIFYPIISHQKKTKDLKHPKEHNKVHHKKVK